MTVLKKYNVATSEWEVIVAGVAGPTGPAGASALWNFTGAYDTGSSYAVGDIATYGGETWYRIDANGGNTGDTPVEGTFWTLIAEMGATGPEGPTGSIDTLSDVVITSAATGQVLKYDGVNWVNDTDDAGTTIDSIDDINDVTITSVASGDFLQWNGTAWVNEPSPTYVQLDTSVGSPAQSEGKLQWDSDFGTLSFGLEGNNSLQQIGMNQFAYCYNAEATTLNKGEAVYIFGGQGSQVSIKRASNVGDPTSSKTLGIVSESIAAGGSGYVCTYGVLQGINTLAYAEGAILYLGETAGTLTATEPTTPNHLVFVAVVIKSDNGGELWIRPQNGYEINELHDVLITDKISGDFLKYNGTLWVNDQINLGTDTVGNYVSDVTAGTGVSVTHTPDEGSSPTIAIGQAVASTDSPTFAGVTADNIQVGITGANEIDTTSGNLTIDSAGGTVTIDDNLVVSGDLTVNGTTTTLNTETLAVEDNIVVLNAGVTASPTLDAGIEVERGTSTNVSIKWNETTDKWQFTNDGTTYTDLGAGGAIVSDTAPSSPETGQLWFESDSGMTFVYYDSSWVEVGSGGPMGANGTDAVYDTAQAVISIQVFS